MKNKRQGNFLPKTGIIAFTFLFFNLAEAAAAYRIKRNHQKYRNPKALIP
jgi:hypothetical protein